jgi:hypothetical protein
MATYAILRKIQGNTMLYDSPMDFDLRQKHEAERDAERANAHFAKSGLVPPYNNVVSKYFAVEVLVNGSGLHPINPDYHLS